MRRLGLLLVVVLTACAQLPQARATPTATAQATSATSPTPVAPPTTPTVAPTPTPPPSAFFEAGVTCTPGANPKAVAVVGYFIYDVSDPLHPGAVCQISNTLVHLFTGTSLEYLAAGSAGTTDVVLHAFGSNNESRVASLPFTSDARFTVAWSQDGSLAAHTAMRVDSGGLEVMDVYLYASGRDALLYTYRLGIGDCICRFGLPPQVLAFSPDGEYLVSGWISGKGSEPLRVYRVADGALATTLPIDIMRAIWGRGGHVLFTSGNNVSRWTPESGMAALPGAQPWWYGPALSADGFKITYTAYADQEMTQPRVYIYNLKTATTRILVDQPRSEAIFVSDWVWYLEEKLCAPNACSGPWSSDPTGRVFAFDISSGKESPVSFSAGETPFKPPQVVLAGGDVWPRTDSPSSGG
jgi:WD40 repeat protein